MWMLIGFLWVVCYLFTMGAMTQAGIFPKEKVSAVVYGLMAIFFWPVMLGKIWVRLYQKPAPTKGPLW